VSLGAHATPAGDRRALAAAMIRLFFNYSLPPERAEAQGREPCAAAFAAKTGYLAHVYLCKTVILCD
jgi:hypothetical protein